MSLRFQFFLFLVISWTTASLSFASPAAKIPLHGVVTADGTPFPDARILLSPTPIRYDANVFALETRRSAPVASTQSAEDGSFTLSAPDIGMWTVRVEADGYIPREYAFWPLLEESYLPIVDLEPARDAIVALRDSDGTPLVGRVLAVRSKKSNPYQGSTPRDPWGIAYQSARSDEKGNVRLDLPETGLKISAFVPGYLPTEIEFDEAGRHSLPLEVATQREIRVVASDGKPVEGVILLSQEPSIALLRTDAEGRALLPDDVKTRHMTLLGPEGRRTIVALPPRDPGHEGELIWTLPEAERLRGQVVEHGSGNPVADAIVWASGSSGDFVRTDLRGMYDLAVPPLGALDPAADRGVALWAVGRRHIRGYASLKTSAQGGPTLELYPTAALQGRVLDPQERPLQGIEIELTTDRSSVRGVVGISTPRLFVRSDAQGKFRFGRVPAAFAHHLRIDSAGWEPIREVIGPIERATTREDLVITLRPGRVAFGWVVDESHQPIAGAGVFFTQLKKDTGRFVAATWERPGSPAREPDIFTDHEGRFEIPNLAPGRYELIARAQGFSAVSIPGVEIPRQSEARSVDVGTVVLSPGVRLEGRTVDPDGIPLSTVAVYVLKTQAATDVRWIMNFLQHREPDARSDQQGNFVVTDLSPGERVQLVAVRDGYLDAVVSDLQAPSEEAPGASSVELVLHPAAQIRGRVVDDTGQAIGGASVNAVSAGGNSISGNLQQSTETDLDGTFELQGLAGGLNRLSVSATGFLSFRRSALDIPAGGLLEHPDIVLTRGLSLEGTVRGRDGEARSHVSIRAIEPGATSYDSSGWAKTDGNGYYHLQGLRPVLYQVTASDQGNHVQQEADLAAGTDRLDFTLESAEGEVSGRVVGPIGEPVEGARVQLQGSRVSSAVTQVDGRFQLQGVATGTYVISATKADFADALHQEIEVREEEPLTGLELQLTQGSTLRGQILGLEFDDFSDLRLHAWLDGSGMRTGTVSYDGTYEIRHLVPGTWTASASLESQGRRVEETIEIEEGMTEARLDLEFVGGSQVLGSLWSDGRPAAGATISIRPADFETAARANRRGSSRVATDGTFRIRNLSDGFYIVSAYDAARGISHREEVEVFGDTDLRIELMTQEISGRLRDLYDGSPIEGATVDLLATDSGNSSTQSRSDSLGFFQMKTQLGGDRTLRIRRSGYAPLTMPLRLDAARSSDLQDLELEMEPTEGIVVEPILPPGENVRRVTAALLRGNETVLVGSWTLTEEGKLRINEVPAGAYELLLQTPKSAITSVSIRSPGPVGPVRMTPGTRLKLSVPELADVDLEAVLVLTGPDGRPYRRIRRHTVEPEIRLFYGKATILSLSPGIWTATVRTIDGRSWSQSIQINADTENTLTLGTP